MNTKGNVFILFNVLTFFKHTESCMEYLKHSFAS